MMKTLTGDRFTHRCKDTDPGKDREEAEGDGGSGGVGALGQWQLVGRRSLPLIGQETESNEPQEAGKTWRRDTEESKKVTWIIVSSYSKWQTTWLTTHWSTLAFSHSQLMVTSDYIHCVSRPSWNKCVQDVCCNFRMNLQISYRWCNTSKQLCSLGSGWMLMFDSRLAYMLFLPLNMNQCPSEFSLSISPKFVQPYTTFSYNILSSRSKRQEYGLLGGFWSRCMEPG